MNTQYDVCVVGGGASGMAAAIAAAEGGNTVFIIDKNKKLVKKLYATGNGRCNLANTDMKDGWQVEVSVPDITGCWIIIGI